MSEITPNIEFKAQYVPPGTLYPDEPSEVIPAGWWVVGRSPLADPEDGNDVEVHVEWATDGDGVLLDEQVAVVIVEALTEKFGDPS